MAVLLESLIGNWTAGGPTEDYFEELLVANVQQCALACDREKECIGFVFDKIQVDDNDKRHICNLRSKLLGLGMTYVSSSRTFFACFFA